MVVVVVVKMVVKVKVMICYACAAFRVGWWVVVAPWRTGSLKCIGRPSTAPVHTHTHTHVHTQHTGVFVTRAVKAGATLLHFDDADAVDGHDADADSRFFDWYEYKD